MTIILNLTTKEYFVTNSETEQQNYLKKLLLHIPPTLLLDWKSDTYFTIFKSVIRWNRSDRIIIVPHSTETYVLENKNYAHISINPSGIVTF